MAYSSGLKSRQRTISGEYQNVPITFETDSRILTSQTLETKYSSSPSYSLIPVNNEGSYEIARNSEEKPIKIVCISDTHNGHRNLKFSDRIKRMHGDILIHAGDFSDHGTLEEIMDAFNWLCSLKNFTYKIFISGNMDGIGLDDKHSNNRMQKPQRSFENNNNNVIYLENSFCTVLGIKIFGCPYTPKFVGGFQYNRRSIDAKQIWNQIPEDCDILVSHGPPAGILDKSSRGEYIGCSDLRDAIFRKNSLKAVIFGHVHQSYGVTKENNKWFINAAQYYGIYNNDTHNEPIELFIRPSDKSICGLIGI